MKKIPLYSKIIDELKERIRTGDFEYDVPFVTEEKITKEYNVSRITAIIHQYHDIVPDHP